MDYPICLKVGTKEKLFSRILSICDSRQKTDIISTPETTKIFYKLLSSGWKIIFQSPFFNLP
jgi:hypothetical protein